METTRIRTYILNLEKRTDRQAHVLNEFNGRDEFNIELVRPVKHDIAAVSLWNTIKYILRELVDSAEEHILLCEDDHQFTKNYSKERLFEAIAEAKSLNADILSGGVSWWEDAVPISNKLFWVKKFSGLQFTIIFKKFFSKILFAEFGNMNAADYKISGLSNKSFFCHPFISTQKEFGYSDVTTKNNGSERVEKLFAMTEQRCNHLTFFSVFYKKIKPTSISPGIADDITIPTYIICRNMDEQTALHIQRQFIGKNEFETSLVQGITTDDKELDLWKSIKHVISIAIEKEDDIIVVCEDSHVFENSYNRQHFIQNILEAHYLHTEILCGNATDLGMALPVGNKFWVDRFSGTTFFVLYKSVFKKILNTPDRSTSLFYHLLSSCSSYKMALAPFVSSANNELANPSLNQSEASNSFTRVLNRLDVLSNAENFQKGQIWME
ncbi:hypothetical protein [Niabella beijingensis]|uniref:hypothetical protein n=1 Tax=Niabella beijingensis TaxID=2872700 RepID=UPI001CC0148C|nr:hypothetical protein [Niabella beijingensis]MBZ4190589.1 hypothetical protein [Niabella beijingensis]